MKKWLKRSGILLLWIVLVLETLSMADAGMDKYFSWEGWSHWFERWGYGAWFAAVVGVTEFSGALLLLIPWLSSYAAALLIVVMLGAFYTVTTKPTDLSWFDPLFHALLLSVVMIWRWGRRWRPSGNSASRRSAEDTARQAP